MPAPTPRLRWCRITTSAPAARASPAVSSAEQSSTTMTVDAQRRGTLRTTSPIFPVSFHAGTTTATWAGSIRAQRSGLGSRDSG
jgi:hypothetical protein